MEKLTITKSEDCQTTKGKDFLKSTIIMTNLTNAQTELLKYLHSQIGETQKRINSDVSRLVYWIECKDSSEGEKIGLKVCDYEINKLQTTIESSNYRFKWLIKELYECNTYFQSENVSLEEN